MQVEETDQRSECQHEFRHNDHEGIITIDQDGKVTVVNQAAAIALGFTQQELLGKNLHCAIQNDETGLHAYIKKIEAANHDLESFNAIVVHDLKMPLRKIRVFSEYILNDAENKLSEASQDYFQRIQKAIHAGEMLIHNMVALTKASYPDHVFTVIKLSRLIEDVRTEFCTVIQEKHAQIEISPLPDIEGNASQLWQLFYSLIENALKYNQLGVCPVIKIYADQLSELQVAIVVQDHGIGFDSEQSERIFDPFYRLQGGATDAGSGLGLTICKKIAELHHGSITAQGIPNQGAVFTVTLPFLAVR